MDKQELPKDLWHTIWDKLDKYVDDPADKNDLATEILEQVEAGYISKQDYDTMTQKVIDQKKELHQLNKKLANSIPKDRVREDMQNFKRDFMEYGSADDAAVADYCSKLLGES